MDLFCFGDSITRGEYDAERGGWVDRVKTAAMARFLATGGEELCVMNLGVSGETTRGLKARFAAELSARLEPGVRSLVLLAYGANDAAEREGARVVPVAEYEANLTACLEAARGRCEAALVTVTPVAPAADRVRNPCGKLRSNAVIAEYNAALRALSSRHGVGLIDAHAAFAGRDLPGLFVADGVHPNAAGHALIAGAVELFLRLAVSRP